MSRIIIKELQRIDSIKVPAIKETPAKNLPWRVVGNLSPYPTLGIEISISHIAVG